MRESFAFIITVWDSYEKEENSYITYDLYEKDFFYEFSFYLLWNLKYDKK